MRFAVVATTIAAKLVAACYEPTPPAEVPCGTGDPPCPSGQMCGNGACETGESPGCYADCGPVPWTWSGEEQALLALVNNIRTTGHQCPNDTMPATRPALVVENAMQATAREWSWEIAHENVFITGGAACNGRTFDERRAQGANFTTYIQSRTHASIQIAFDSWIASATICPLVMTNAATKVSIAVSHDVNHGYVVLLKP